DVGDELALLGVVRDDGLLARLAAGEELVEDGHDELAAGLGRLVAALAVGLEDRPDLLIVADRRFGAEGGRGAECERKGEPGRPRRHHRCTIYVCGAPNRRDHRGRSRRRFLSLCAPAGPAASVYGARARIWYLIPAATGSAVWRIRFR